MLSMFMPASLRLMSGSNFPPIAAWNVPVNFNNLVLTNTLGLHKPSKRWTWHSSNRKLYNQTGYILVRDQFQSEVTCNSNRTRSFPGADIVSDHVHVIMTFRVRLKKRKKPIPVKTGI